VASDTLTPDPSQHPPGRRHADVDDPLFDPDLIPNAGDPRSVGELLRDVDLHARELLFDVSGTDADGLLRGWPDVIDAAAQLWQALPGRPEDHDLCADLDRPMTRLTTLSDGLVLARGFRRWPGNGPVDHRFHQIASTLAQAASLVHRYGADVAPNEKRVRGDIQATRTRLMHAVYLSAHAVTVALHDHSRDLRVDAAREGTPLPMSANRSPYLVASTADWAQRIGVCERTAGAYLGHRFPEQLAGDAGDAPDPTRLRRALASWDIQAHRTLAAHPTPANLVLASATHARIADTSALLLQAAAAAGAGPPSPATLRSAVKAAAQAWAELASRWRDLTLPQARLDPALARAAGEVRAAYSGLTTHQGSCPATPAMIATRPGFAEAVHASLEALEASTDLAYVVNEKANHPHLTGPARALSLRAHNDAEQAREGHPRNPRNHDVPWITPREIHAHKVVLLPSPVADGLRRATWEAIQATASLSAARSPGAQSEVSGLAEMPPNAVHPVMTVRMGIDLSNGQPI
jgi:hypothetical protein